MTEPTKVTVRVKSPPVARVIKTIKQGSSSSSGGVAATGVSGAVISAHTMIVDIGGQLFPADCSNIEHCGQVVGMANTAANTSGLTIEFTTIGGVCPNGSFTAGKQYILGKNGALVDVGTIPSDAVFLQFVGLGLDATNFLVDLEDPTIL